MVENNRGVGNPVPPLHPTGGASVYCSLDLGGRKVQKSTGLKDRKQAEAYARDVVRIIAERQREGRVSNPTLGQVFSIYFRERAPLLRHARRQATEARRALFEAAWGANQRSKTLVRRT